MADITRLASVLAFLSAVAACSSGSDGSSTDGATAGAGSGGSAGDGCLPGATQACTGPAACSGGQVCASDGKSWGACDCGSGGKAGAGGKGAGGVNVAGFPGAGPGTGGQMQAAGGAATAAGGSPGAGGSPSAGGSPGAGGSSSGGNPGAGGDPVGVGGASSPGEGGSPDVGGSTSAGGSPGTGGSGVAGMGGTMLDLHQAMLFDNPQNVADWPITTSITEVDFQYNGMDGVHVEFDKRDGPNRWPDITPPGWTGPLQYTLGMAEYIDGQWVASAAIQFWYGLDQTGGNVAANNQIAMNWYYDSRWGPLAGRQPATGEMVGIFVVAGNLRGVTDGSQSPAMERSNVVLVPFPDVNGAKYTF